MNEFKSSVQVSGPISVSGTENSSYSYRFNSDPGLVNNDYYFALPVAGGHGDSDPYAADGRVAAGGGHGCGAKDVLIEINQSILGLLLKKQQIIHAASSNQHNSSGSSSSSLPLGSTSLVFLTNQLIAECLDVENSFLSAAPQETSSRTPTSRKGSKKKDGNNLNDSISIEDRSFEEEKNRIRDRFSRILFHHPPSVGGSNNLSPSGK